MTPSRRFVLAAVVMAAMTAGLGHGRRAHATEVIESTRQALVASADGDGFVLNADFALNLHGPLEDAVNRGVVLYFILEFELNRDRWYWFNEQIAETSQTYRLSYHALTQQYRLALNGYTQRYAVLDEALAAISRIRGWRVIEAGRVSSGTVYEAGVRLRLDTTQLPKPFQITAITDRDWNPTSEWKRFPFSPETPTSEPSAAPSVSR